MNSSMRFGLRLLLACMLFAFVFAVFFVSTPSTAVASPGWENVLSNTNVKGADDYEPSAWVHYVVGDYMPVMAACQAGSGRVVATGASWSIRNGQYYVESCDIRQMIDATFQWLTNNKQRSQIKVLWYKGYGVYDQNRKESCKTLVDYLKSKGYTDANIVSDGTEPLASILSSDYDILFIPQLQAGGADSEPFGGDPTVIPDSDYEAIRHFVEDLGKGLLLLEGCDYHSHSYPRVQNEILKTIESGMYFQSDEVQNAGGGYTGLSFNVNTSSGLGQTYQSLGYGTTCRLSSICSMTAVEEPPHPGMSGAFFPSFKYGAPGETISYTVTVTNSGTIVDSYDLEAADNLSWGGISITPSTLTSVAPSTSATATLSITIPPGASRGSSAKITLTITSHENTLLKKYAYASAHVAPLPVDAVMGQWTFVQASPRVLNYNTCVEGVGQYIYIMNNIQSGKDAYNHSDYFMRYNTVTGYWDDLHRPTGGWKNNGHQMCWDHGNYIYAASGGTYTDSASRARHQFWRYDIANDSWTTLSDTPMWQGPGDALVWVKIGTTEYIYAWLGTTSSSVPVYSGPSCWAELWRYNISAGSWDSQFIRHVDGYANLGDTPSAAQAENGYGADDGCNLVWTGGDYIYYTPGAFNEQLPKEQERYLMRYTISTNTLAEMAKAPYNADGGWDDGGSLVYPGSGDYIYVLKGGDDLAGGGGSPGDEFWRYKISTNTWETLPNIPVGIGEMNGCRLGYVSVGELYYWVGPNNNSPTLPWQNLYVYGIEFPSVDVSISPSENIIEDGTVTYTVTVSNTGNASDTYSMTTADTMGWTKSLSKTSVGPLASGASENIKLSVTIPAGTAKDTSDSITVIATSQADSTVKDNASCTARCSSPYGVDVSISPASQSGLSGSTLTYTVTVKNIGEASDTYSLTASDNALPHWSPILFSKTSVGPLAQNASESVTLSVTVPVDIPLDTRDNITVIATSTSNSTVKDNASCIGRCANPYGVDVSISPTSQSGVLGNQITYTVTVTNTGTVSDTFTLEKTDTAGWTKSLSKTSVGPLASDAFESVTLTVTVPSDALDAAYDTITVKATSQADTTVKDNASCTARAILATSRGVIVSITPLSKSGENGATLTYTVTVSNTGNVTEDYNISKTDTLGWNLTLTSSVEDVAPAEDRQVTLTVVIPATAEHNASDNITVTAKSSENTAIENSATCKAICAKGGVTSLTISQAAFALFPGYSGQVQSLTATLRSGNDPLSGKTITWSVTAGSVSPSSGTTDASGQVSVVYTAPTVTAETPQVTITASFAGDSQYQASSGTSSGIPAVVTEDIPADNGGIVPVYIINYNITVNMLVIQPNALSENTTITVVQQPVDAPAGYAMLSNIFDIGPSGTTFATPSTLTLPYNASELPAGVSAGDLAIYYRASAGGSWQLVGGTVDTAANTVSVEIDHLSEYAVMASTGGGGGLPLLLIVAVVVVIVIVAIIAVFIRRR